MGCFRLFELSVERSAPHIILVRDAVLTVIECLFRNDEPRFNLDGCRYDVGGKIFGTPPPPLMW